MTIAGVLGFAIGIVAVMQIQATSPLTHNVSSTAKACVQTALAFVIWKNTPTFNAILGNVFVLLGSSLYAYIRLIEDMAQSKKNTEIVNAAKIDSSDVEKGSRDTVAELTSLKSSPPVDEDELDDAERNKK
jgi:GDP-fucose transporter C1